MTNIILHGYMGTMGKVIRGLAHSHGVEIVAGIDSRPPCGTTEFPTFTDISECDIPADVILDFSIAGAVPKLMDYVRTHKTPVVICTTGLSPEQEMEIIEASANIAVFRSANMSIGVNLIASVLKKISPLLYGTDFDIEIIEKHHNKKVDAPSGTAFLLANALKESISELVNTTDRYDRREPRKHNELGISSLRGGTIVGEHSVIFSGKDEVIEITHSAYSKEVFAVGAIQAVLFLKDKPAGMYSMQNIMEAL